MTKIDLEWLNQRGNLHDARITGIRVAGTSLEVDIDDEWVNERGIGLPKGEKLPATLSFSAAATNGTIVTGSRISELLMQSDGSFLFFFTDATSVLVRAASAEVRSKLPEPAI